MNYDAIREEMQTELDAPGVYMVNSPGAYIRDRLFQKGHAKEAVFFWGAYVSRYFKDESIQELYLKLEALEKKQTMPSWGVGKI